MGQNHRMRALAPAVALLALLLLAPPTTRPPAAAPVRPAAAVSSELPRGWAIDRVRRLRAIYPRVDRAEAKLASLAEWYQASGSAPLPAQPTRAPGSAPAVVDRAALRPVIRPESPERVVWVVALSGEVHASFGPGAVMRWGGEVLDARSGDVLQGFAGSRESWPPYWDQLPDRAAGAEGLLVPSGGPYVPRERAERRGVGADAERAGVRSYFLTAAAAGRMTGSSGIPPWVHPGREVWLVVAHQERPAPRADFFAVVDATIGADLWVGQMPGVAPPA